MRTACAKALRQGEVCVWTELIEENEERGRWGGWRERKDPERKTCKLGEGSNGSGGQREVTDLSIEERPDQLHLLRPCLVQEKNQRE